MTDFRKVSEKMAEMLKDVNNFYEALLRKYTNIHLDYDEILRKQDPDSRSICLFLLGFRMEIESMLRDITNAPNFETLQRRFSRSKFELYNKTRLHALMLNDLLIKLEHDLFSEKILLPTNADDEYDDDIFSDFADPDLALD